MQFALGATLGADGWRLSLSARRIVTGVDAAASSEIVHFGRLDDDGRVERVGHSAHCVPEVRQAVGQVAASGFAERFALHRVTLFRRNFPRFNHSRCFRTVADAFYRFTSASICTKFPQFSSQELKFFTLPPDQPGI